MILVLLSMFSFRSQLSKQSWQLSFYAAVVAAVTVVSETCDVRPVCFPGSSNLETKHSPRFFNRKSLWQMHAGNRSKMDKLVRVRRLLQRLDFLFQLPQKLEEAVQEGQYAKAIR